MPLFKGESPTHTASCVSPIGKPPTPWYTKWTQRQQGAKILYKQQDFAWVGPLSVVGMQLIRPSLKAVRTRLILDISVREPDWLCLSSNPPLLGSSPYNLCEDIFHEGPLARRAKPCTHKPQQPYRLQQQVSKTQMVPPRTAKTHCHSGVRDNYYSCRGSPVRCSVAQISEANACEVWLTLWSLTHTVMDIRNIYIAISPN